MPSCQFVLLEYCLHFVSAVAFKIARAYDQATNAHLNCAELEKDMKSYPWTFSESVLVSERVSCGFPPAQYKSMPH